MSGEYFEVSNSGIKMSYVRFLADIMPGYVFILLLYLLYYHPVLGQPINCFVQLQFISGESKWLLIALILMAGIGIGIALNGLSLLLFGWGQTSILPHLMSKDISILSKPARKWYSATKVVKLFCNLENDEGSKWISNARHFREVLNIWYPHVGTAEFMIGMQIFFESVSVIIALLIGYIVYTEIFFGLDPVHLWHYIFLLLCLALSFLISIVASTWYNLQILFKIYILTIDIDEIKLGKIPPCIDYLTKKLIEKAQQAKTL